MKKYLLSILLFIMFIPLYVNAETCDSSNIKIESIKLNTTTGNAEEVTEASINDKKINLDLKMYDPGDSIEYILKVKNTSKENFYFDEESLKINTDYLQYKFIYDDNSNIVEAGKEKNIKLRVEYKNKVPAEKLVNDSFNDTNTMTINLSNKDIINVPDTIKNPETGDMVIRYVLVILIASCILLISLKSKKSIKYMILLISVSVIIPYTVYALCKCDIEVEAKIQIDGKEAYFLIGPEVNIKMKQLAGDDTSTNNEKTVDTNIIAIKESAVEPINSNKEEKNLVSTQESTYPIYIWFDNGTIYWWSEDKTPNLNEDSSFMFNRFSNLVNIEGLKFMDAKLVTSLKSTFASNSSILNYNELSDWNTSNVIDMQGTFGGNTSLIKLTGLEDWDVSNVINMVCLFCQNKSVTELMALTNWNVSKVEDMSQMFMGNLSLKNVDGLENWDVSSLKNMYGMFMGHSSFGDMNIEDLSSLSNWDVSNVENMRYVFQKCTKLQKLNGLENWNVSNVTNMQGLFYYDTILNDITALENWNVSNVTNMRAMFQFCNKIETLNSIKKWNVRNVTTFRAMFGDNESLTDASGINYWDVSKNAEFLYMFQNVSVKPEFTYLPGTWQSNGTFIPD